MEPDGRFLGEPGDQINDDPGASVRRVVAQAQPLLSAWGKYAPVARPQVACCVAALREKAVERIDVD